MVGSAEMGAIHTYVELYARMFVDLTPHVALVCAEMADAHGNLYTGPNTEDDTKMTVEATADFRRIGMGYCEDQRGSSTNCPRVDGPGLVVDYVKVAHRPLTP